ncbi:hypothetical protein ACYSNM_05755 [Myroides sp. LJL116]
MKEIINKIGFVIGCLILFSCSSDDNSSGTNSELQSLLIGTWSIQAVMVGDRPETVSECALQYEKNVFYPNSQMLEQYGQSGNYSCRQTSLPASYDLDMDVLKISREYEKRDLFWKITFLDDNTLKMTLIRVREEGIGVEDVPEGRRETYIYSRDK